MVVIFFYAGVCTDALAELMEGLKNGMIIQI
jgi:hypothetical protein